MKLSEIFPNLEWLTKCTYTQPNSSKEIARLQDYKLLFIRGTTIDHTGQKLHVQVPFSASFGN